MIFSTLSSSAFLRTYSARPNTVFERSRIASDSSSTLFDRLPADELQFSPYSSVVAHCPSEPSGLP